MHAFAKKNDAGDVNVPEELKKNRALLMSDEQNIEDRSIFEYETGYFIMNKLNPKHYMNLCMYLVFNPRSKLLDELTPEFLYTLVPYSQHGMCPTTAIERKWPEFKMNPEDTRWMHGLKVRIFIRSFADIIDEHPLFDYMQDKKKIFNIPDDVLADFDEFAMKNIDNIPYIDPDCTPTKLVKLRAFMNNHETKKQIDSVLAPMRMLTNILRQM